MATKKTNSIVKQTSIEIEKTYLIRSVTHYYVGRVKEITETDLLLEDASWVADTGRFHEALKSGSLNEVEPFKNDAIVMRAGVIDMTHWPFELPRSPK